MLKQATETLSNCTACLTVIDAGDWFDPRLWIHAECRDLNRAGSLDFQLTGGPSFADSVPADLARGSLEHGIAPIFDGESITQFDTPRLAGQLARVYELMSDGEYRTLEEIARLTGCLATSASSRLRDFRKQKFGGHAVVSRQVEGVPLLYEYRLIANKRDGFDAQRDVA